MPFVWVHDWAVPDRPIRQAVDEAADALRRILTAIENGELEVTTPQDIALVRRLEGAVSALEEATGRRKDPRAP